MQRKYRTYQRPERRLYREHKYVTSVMNELDNKIAKTDFRDINQIKEIANGLSNVINLLTFHAKHEDEKIHTLLKKHNSYVVEEIESGHQKHEAIFDHLKEKLALISKAESEREKVDEGYLFYLSYRRFIAENLEHIYKEETLLMPELARLCTKEELESIDYPVYQSMTSEQMVGMLKTLFTVLNFDDKKYFITDLVDAVPDKVVESWSSIAALLTASEIADMANRIVLIKQLAEKQLGYCHGS
ncbi:hemerythrin domain-containing protein [Legionella brunensis]|uniref:Hemerythrin-like domain-containing protein n=1 Tax=Legionella brunensis TaxID=29422 RepID=A0A0W0SU93_9GAMM|nr:hemerythrin domain-containing protein [Legionella brunensis]KTC86852.1 hypothetical protein Lbru_0081 [Legionella brunensis]